MTPQTPREPARHTGARTVILANGNFPSHPVPLTLLDQADFVICCDGGANKLVASGRTPDLIIGDLDSLDQDLRIRFADRVIEDPDQETNDLTKAVRWCLQQEIQEVTLLAASGDREDHTLANLALLARYHLELPVEMITDTGRFTVARHSQTFETTPGQQVSIFAMAPDTEITASGLKYPLDKLKLAEWWQGSLNEAVGDRFSLSFNAGALLVYRTFPTQR